MVCIPGLPQSIIQDSKVVRSGISKQAPVAVAITSIKLGFFLKCIRLPNHNSIDKQWYVYHLQMDGSSIPSYKIFNCEMVIRRGLVLLSNEQFLQVQSTKTNGQIFSTHPICSMNMFLHGNGFVQKLGFPMFSQKTKKNQVPGFQGKICRETFDGQFHGKPCNMSLKPVHCHNLRRQVSLISASSFHLGLQQLFIVRQQGILLLRWWVLFPTKAWSWET